MTRPEITKFLSEMLVAQRFCGFKYWASEVTLNYGTINQKRVDFMQFEPKNTTVSGIEKGEFICYEVKSCLDDYKSGHGKNFEGDRNYLIMPMELYGYVHRELDYYTGVMVPIPRGSTQQNEFNNPTPLDKSLLWDLTIVKNAHIKNRRYSTAELLFCMLRSGK